MTKKAQERGHKPNMRTKSDDAQRKQGVEATRHKANKTRPPKKARSHEGTRRTREQSARPKREHKAHKSLKKPDDGRAKRGGDGARNKKKRRTAPTTREKERNKGVKMKREVVHPCWWWCPSRFPVASLRLRLGGMRSVYYNTMCLFPAAARPSLLRQLLIDPLRRSTA